MALICALFCASLSIMWAAPGGSPEVNDVLIGGAAFCGIFALLFAVADLLGRQP